MDAVTLPEDSAERRAIPLTQGVLQYFPAALAEVAKVSMMGADKHSNGQLIWTRPASPSEEEVRDHLDCVLRHIVDWGDVGRDKESGLNALAHAAWRILAALQVDMESMQHAPVSPNSRVKEVAVTPDTGASLYRAMDVGGLGDFVDGVHGGEK